MREPIPDRGQRSDCRMPFRCPGPARKLARELTSPGRLIYSHPSCLLLAGTQMIRPSLIVLLSWVCSWICLASPAVAAGIDAAAINGADFGTSKPPPADRINALAVKVQVLLDRARFSPG